MALYKPQAVRALAATAHISRPLAARASFHNTALRQSGKEATEKDADKAAAERNEHLKKAEKGKQSWTDELASESESAVKAERNETHQDAKQDTERLQRQTEEAPRKKHGQ